MQTPVHCGGIVVRCTKNSGNLLPITRIWRDHAKNRVFRQGSWTHPRPQHLDVRVRKSRDIVGNRRRVLAHDAPTSHSLMLDAEICRNQRFLPTLEGREHGFAPSWGCRYRDNRQTRQDRGRQQEWHKDLWHLQSLLSWRLSLFRAVTTALRYGSHRTWPFSKPPRSAATLTSQPGHGRTFGFVRATPAATGGA